MSVYNNRYERVILNILKITIILVARVEDGGYVDVEGDCEKEGRAETQCGAGVIASLFSFRLLYPNIFGGIEAFRPEAFQNINGFSNLFFGWGGEDDDLYNR